MKWQRHPAVRAVFQQRSHPRKMRLCTKPYVTLAATSEMAYPSATPLNAEKLLVSASVARPTRDGRKYHRDAELQRTSSVAYLFHGTNSHRKYQTCLKIR